ncbi:MAG TPA: SDR family NAD(P)-dependent oxidoreductase [Terracidiphilus sp.]|nr:SDR family NAD(P)-dependent oxidoreductase [Terracidiphilus sp.]
MATAKTILLTGASSGFGLLSAVTLAKRGWQVIATMRDLGRREKLDEAAKEANVVERIEIRELDVTNHEHIGTLANSVAERAVPLHGLVNNAGFAMAGFAENVSDAELRKQFETNFFGAAAVTRAFLPQLKRQGFGHIVMVSSLSGRVGFPGVGSYAASKFALEGWAETLRFEMRPFGVPVVLLEPGAFETDIWTRNGLVSEKTLALGADPDSPEGARIARWRKKLEARKSRPNPQLVADFLAGILANPKPRLRYSFGTDAWSALALRTFLPWSWFEGMIVKASGIERT